MPSTSIRTPTPSNGRRRLPGRRRRCNCATSISLPPRRALYQRLAGHVLYANPALRSSSDTIRRGLAGQPVAVGAGHIGRQADRAGAHRRGRGCRRRPRAAARPRVLAPEGPGRRSRDPERARRVLRPGPADRPGNPCPHQPVDDPSRDRARPGRHLRPAQRPDLRRDPRPAARRRARRPAEPPRRPGRSAQSRPDAAWRAAACPAQARDRCRSQGNAAACRGPGGAAVLQRPRRLLPQRPGICDRARPWPVDAGALDQRRLQPVLRLPGRGRRRRLHLVAEQPRQSAHALVERSGQRSSRRSALRPRPRQRRPVDADGAADPSRDGALCRPPWPGIQPVRGRGARHRARTAAIRAAFRSHQDLATDHPQRLRPAAAALGHGLRRMGARPVARRGGADHRHRARRGDRCDPRAQSLEHAARHAGGLCRPGRPPDRMDRRSQRVHRTQLHDRQSRGAERRHPAVAARRRRPRSVRGPADDDRPRARRRDRDRLLPRSGRRCRCGAGADRALSRWPISTPSIARSSTTGTRRSARCR